MNCDLQKINKVVGEGSSPFSSLSSLRVKLLHAKKFVLEKLYYDSFVVFKLHFVNLYYNWCVVFKLEFVTIETCIARVNLLVAEKLDSLVQHKLEGSGLVFWVLLFNLFSLSMLQLLSYSIYSLSLVYLLLNVYLSASYSWFSTYFFVKIHPKSLVIKCTKLK
jgi:hypothetical protein